MTYFILEWKKSIRVLRKSVLGMAAMLAALILGVAAVSAILLQSQAIQLINVAVAVPEGEKMTKRAVRFIAAMDSVKSVCRFQYMDRETALREMEDGKVEAVIELPENFYEDVDSGKNTPAVVYFPRQAPLNVELFRELLKAGVSMLQTAEAGVYASLDIAGGYSTETEMEAGQIGNRVALLYADEILERGTVFEKMVCSPMGAADYGQYYFSSLILLVLLTGGLNYGFLYRKQDRSVARKLCLYGMGRWKMSWAKILVMTSMLWMTAVLVYLAGGVAASVGAYEAPDFHVGTAVGLFLLCAAVAAYFHAVYAAVGSGIQGAAALLAVNLAMILGTGLLVPVAYLPDVVGRIGVWFPLAAWSRYHQELMSGTVSVAGMAGTLISLAAGTGIGAACLWKDI